MLRIALMSSENRAASALARSYPGGTEAFVRAMNEKAHELGMTRTTYADPTGLSARQRLDGERPSRRSWRPLRSTRKSATSAPRRAISSRFQPSGQLLGFNNTNGLVKKSGWNIHLSKTGYIREAGKCLVMLATIASKPFVIVLLDSAGKYTRQGDAQRVRDWLETGTRDHCPEGDDQGGQGKRPSRTTCRCARSAYTRKTAIAEGGPRLISP